jgi:hypothetical protein
MFPVRKVLHPEPVDKLGVKTCEWSRKDERAYRKVLKNAKKRRG